jgi:diguanylate cyclase
MFSASQVPAFAAATLAAACLSLTAFGLRRQRYEGWQWWVRSLWLALLGAACAAALPGAVTDGLASLLLMQWPLLSLVGLRHFYPRQALPGREQVDWAVLALASTAVLVSAAVGGEQAAWTAAAFGIALHLYAAYILLMGPSGRDFAPVQALAGVLALVAFAPVLAALGSSGTPELLQVRSAAAALGALVLAFTAITLVCERTERQLRDSRRRLRVLANMDTLTQVPNRRHFHELAEHALQQDEPGTAVLLHFDIDHFKRINDLFGHAAGDRALCLVSTAMLENLRTHDVPGRPGGAEFVLLLRQTIGVAARIVAEVQRRAPQQQLPTLSLSFGVVQIAFGEGMDAALRRADQAMYEAKRQGRSRAVSAAGNEAQPVFAQSERLGLTPA